MSTRRRLAMVVALVGILVVGNQLAGIWPRTVDVAYTIDAGATELDVDYLLGANAIASARFRQPGRKTRVFRHSVRLRPGEYELHITVYPEHEPAFANVRTLVVPTAGTTRFELKPATAGSE